ncbi:copper resistance protein CopC [Candidatus Mycolicibacterium alkanivorans]|uniref:Copper resistance protein CopC n=1 Tax=Candidatus Mycolicibacterium alkanivorans TaxID=2954114 RepID=A0ABS9YSN2_9MYCO|nr:copper resistance protein CopC [Candidatus Mycolicibacterium alkanivorans]MCI4674210.1 copper resistance protein CopC [Candidatus Mycolicibacterium alkanivorans]
MRRLTATVLLIATMAVSGTPVARAHAVRVASDPATDATVSSGPARVSAYTVNYRVTSADGHAVSGSWAFTLTAAGKGAPGPSASAGSGDNGVPVWPFLLGAVLLIGGGAAWALRRRA